MRTRTINGGHRVARFSLASTANSDFCHRLLAVELTERSLLGSVPEDEIRSIDFEVITDNGDDAFIAAAHVGWNLFAPLNGLPEIDEFDSARQIALLAASVVAGHEIDRQIASLHVLHSECDPLHSESGP